MKKNNQKYLTFVKHRIAAYKKQPFGRLVLHGTIGKNRFDLVFLTADRRHDRRIISLLTQWRRKNQRWFQAQFPVSHARTQIWYERRLIQDPDRLLFIIRVEGKYIGHVGLDRFDAAAQSCELDNIMRGEKGYPGIMEQATARLMQWGKTALQLKKFTLCTSSDNDRSLNLYKRLGFVVTKRTPQIYQKLKTGGEWVVAPKDAIGPFKRHLVYMIEIPRISPSRKKISFAGPSMTSREVRYAVDAVKNGWYETFDKDIKKLEQAMAAYVGVKYALAGFCATHSLHLACLVCGFKKGDEVIVTDFSWAATAHVIAYTGATPVFVDIDPATWCIDPKAIEKAITKKTKGIMIVHSFGMPCNMDAIMRIARTHKLKVVEDAAPALGALYRGKKVGGFGDVGCVSFHGAKIAASGEGGMFLTNNKEMYEQAILFSNMGRTNRVANFWCDTMGYEYQIANVTAAVARAQVERIEELVAKKRQIFNWYWKRLRNISQLQLIHERKGLRCNFAYPAVLLKTDTVSRDELIIRLREYNIHGRAAFPRMSRFPMYKARYANPVAAEVEKNGFNLPSALNMTENDVEYACKVLRALLNA